MWWLLAIGCARNVPGESGGDPVPPPVETGRPPAPWSVATAPGLPHRLIATGVAPGAEVRCALDADPGEVHVHVAIGTMAIFDGLLADADYTCTAGPDDLPIAIHTDPLPAGFPTWTMVESEGGSGYTLFNIGIEQVQRLIVVDREGRPRWSYTIPLTAPDVDAQYLGGGRFLYGGGQRLLPTIVDLGGDVSWVGPEPAWGVGYHHQAELLADGTVLTMVHRPLTGADGDDWDSFEIEWIEPSTNEVVRRFDSADGVAAGWLPVPAEGAEDPYHANSVQQIDDDHVLLSLYRSRQVLLLDLATGAPDWQLASDAGGFQIYDLDGVAGEGADWFCSQHAPELLGDRLLLYDNGIHLKVHQSRVVEFEVDPAAKTLRTLWEWTEPGWFEPIFGDVDRLPDGNVLVDRAHSHGAADDQRTEIVELDGVTHLPVWRLRMDADEDDSYRAARIDGCALFANRAYCPEGAP